MRFLLAGATGAIGRQLVPKLVESGHRVTTITRSKAKLDDLSALGAEAVLCDVFDVGRLGRVVARAKPDAVINELTDLPQSLNPRKLNEYYAANTSHKTASAPRALRSSSFALDLVIAVTRWPDSTSFGTSRLPMAPVAPARKSLIVARLHSSSPVSS